jgi:hypothetical protein
MIALRPSVVPGSEIVENTGMTDRLRGFAPAASSGVLIGSFGAYGLHRARAGRVLRGGPYDPIADDDPATSLPAVITAASLLWLSAPGMTGIVQDAVDALLIQIGSGTEDASEEVNEWAGSENTNAAAVILGSLALAWRLWSHLGRSDNDRGDRDRRPLPQRCVPSRVPRSRE